MKAREFSLGAEFRSRAFGPLSIWDTVRWAGVQENGERIHFDRDFARQNGRLKSFIMSGGHRQALLVRTLTDAIGSTGRLLSLRVQHRAPTFEGDTIYFSVRVTETVLGPDGLKVSCDLEGKNQEEQSVLSGTCLLLLQDEST
jgi:acyl dehydratase